MTVYIVAYNLLSIKIMTTVSIVHFILDERDLKNSGILIPYYLISTRG